jgi:hypothetical protein
MYSTWRPLNTATYRNQTRLLENVMRVGVITLRNRNGEHSLAACCMLHAEKKGTHASAQESLSPGTRVQASGLGLMSARSLRDAFSGARPPSAPVRHPTLNFLTERQPQARQISICCLTLDSSIYTTSDLRQDPIACIKRKMQIAENKKILSSRRKYRRWFVKGTEQI